MNDYLGLNLDLLQQALESHCDNLPLPHEAAAAFFSISGTAPRSPTLSNTPYLHQPTLPHMAVVPPRYPIFAHDLDESMHTDTALCFASHATKSGLAHTVSPNNPGANEGHSLERDAIREPSFSSHGDQDPTLITSYSGKDLACSGLTCKNVLDIQYDTYPAPTAMIQSRSARLTHPPAAAHTLTPAPPSYANICAVQNTDNPRVFVFRCMAPRCRRRVFSRWYDFNRHYNGTHSVEKTVFWCPVAGCVRGEDEGHRSFPRRDKMMDHALKIHGLDERNVIFRARDT